MLIRLEVADKYSRAAFPQTLPHSAGNGREKSGAGAPACSKLANDLFSLRVYLKKEVQNLLFSGMMVGRKVRDAA